MSVFVSRRASRVLGIAGVDTGEIQRAIGWLKDWIDQAHVRAQGAYPDNYDFVAAGIEPASMLAAEDLYAVLARYVVVD